MARRWLANACVVAGSALCTYLVCETAATAWFRFTGRGSSEWFFEDSGRTVHFDPIAGFRLTQEPSRWTRITNGIVEYVGVLRGNRQGYPSAQDFTARRESPAQRRIAVLGDSFTAAQFNSVNWPHRAEQDFERDGYPLELMNFAVDGGGLANWWSVLTREVGPQGYELDGVVFAVFTNDLYRRFLFAEDRGYQSHMYGRATGWDPGDLPRTFEDARPLLRQASGSHVVSRADFDAVLRGRRPASVPLPPLRPVIARMVWHLLLDYFHPAKLPDGWNAGQIAMMADIRRLLEERNIPAVVVYLPGRDELQAGRDQLARPAPELLRAAQDFGSRIGAQFWDGTQAFRGATGQQIRGYFFPYDYHWNQAGSDRFAHFMAPRLEQFTRRF